MKRILITLLVLLVIAAGGAYFLFLKVITPEGMPVKVMNAEEVVATSGTIAIASVDMSYIRRMDDMFKAVKDPSPLPAPKSDEPKAEKTLLEKLKEQGVDLYSKTDHALAAINIAQEKPAYTLVLFGHFSPDALLKVIHQQYLIDKSAEGYWLIEKLPEQVKKYDPCTKPAAKKSAPGKQALHIQKDRILLSSPELMPVLLKRFSKKARAGVSLEKWRQFRKDKAVAGAFMSPKEAKKGAVDLPSALLMGALSKQPLRDIYAGAVLSLLPSPGFTLLIDAHSSETAWPLEIKTRFDAWINDAVSDLQEMPTLASLIKTLNVQADGNILRFKTTADRKTLDNLEKLPGEFVQMAFSGVFGDGEAGPAGAEQIVKDSEVEKYAQQFDFSSIQPFDNKGVFYNPDYVVGPFAVRLKKIGLLATDDSIIELKVDAEGKGFENLSGEMMHKSEELPAASLMISRVEDKEGNNLLREELCGKRRNLAVASMNTSRDKEHVNGKWISKTLKVSGDKSVRLKQNVPLSQVAKIRGKIAIRAATRTKVQTLQHPFSGRR